MDEQQMLEEFQSAVAELQKVYARIEMATMALEAIIERTQNFREGFFSIKKLNHLRRESAKFMDYHLDLADPTAAMATIKKLTIDTHARCDEIMTEIERLDA